MSYKGRKKRRKKSPLCVNDLIWIYSPKNCGLMIFFFFLPVPYLADKDKNQTVDNLVMLGGTSSYVLKDFRDWKSEGVPKGEKT